MVPHMTRHGGASKDTLDGSPEPEVQTRGRWGAKASVARYNKHGRLFRQLAKLSLDEVARARIAEIFIKTNVARYKKHGRYLRQLATLFPDEVARARLAEI